MAKRWITQQRKQHHTTAHGRC